MTAGIDLTPTSRPTPQRMPETRQARPPADRTAAEAKSRFEDALARKDPGKEMRDEDAAGLVPSDAPPPNLHHRDRDDGGHKDRREPRTAAPEAVDGAATSAERSSAGAEPTRAAGSMPAGPADLSAFAARLDLADRGGDTMLHLSMPDTRWRATEAVVAQSADGGLTLDIGSRGDGGDERTRDALRARLEARGHRIDALRFDGEETGPRGIASEASDR